MIKLYRLAAFIPAILIMIYIFHMSNQPAGVSSTVSRGVSYDLVCMVDTALHLNLPEEIKIKKSLQIEGFVRKGAHVTEYTFLGLSVLLPLFLYAMHDKKRYLVSFFICVLYAVSDEIHQLFIPGRSGMLRDVFIDSIGIVIACLIVYLAQSFVKKRASKAYSDTSIV